jgi:5-formyltetrahydrofolate cyclo-ligase
MIPDKAELRRAYCDLRECQSPEDIAAASRAMCQLLAVWPPLARARTVLAYLAFRNELDLRPLFSLLPHTRWVVPRLSSGRQMTIHPYDPDRLVRHRFGMLEPDPLLPEITPDEIDVALIPGVAFDRHGARLGFGGGYYDRFLPRTNALRVGIALQSCVADELPCADHDQRVDWVATPAGMTRCDPARSEQSR